MCCRCPALERVARDLTNFDGVKRFLIGQEPYESKSISCRGTKFEPAAPRVVGPVEVVLSKRLLVRRATLIDAHRWTDENVEHRYCKAFPLVVLVVIKPAQLGGFCCRENCQQSVPEVGDQVQRRRPKDIVVEFVTSPSSHNTSHAVPPYGDG